MAEYRFDAAKKTLGRLASEIAVILQGKKSPRYNPRLPGEDHVVVRNIARLRVTGKKLSQKVYYRHTGRPGGLKTRTLGEALARDPRWVLREAVRRMLPKNRLLRSRMRRLHFEEDSNS
ncbi:50S ribosomal protein L13 [Candidatus Parcubacteria bacterium]|nr:MAG: 50S ribosomal protein L13 [Candidatus Parcubacteria bacterium]